MWNKKLINIDKYQQRIRNLKDLLGNKQNEFSIANSEKADSKKVEKLLEKLWFFENGTKFPKPAKIGSKTRLMPNEAVDDDRIVNQLMFVPPNYEEIKKKGKLKNILLYDGFLHWNIKMSNVGDDGNRKIVVTFRFNKLLMFSGRSLFTNSKCPVDTCKVTSDRAQLNSSDLVIFKSFSGSQASKNPRQLFMLYLLESPHHTDRAAIKTNIFNWTATYRL